MTGFRWYDGLPGPGFACLYLLTLSGTLSLTHDSAAYLHRVATLSPAALPNHLWFEPAMTTAVRAAWWLWPGSNAQTVMEAVSALFGGVLLQACYVLGVWRLGLPRRIAMATVICAGLTYAVWYYSVAIETYIPPLAICAWVLVGLTTPVLRWPMTIACAVAHALAILLHQTAVLLAPVAAVAWLSTSDGRRHGVPHVLGYACLVGVLVGGAYLLAARDAGYGRPGRTSVLWAMGHLPQRRFWSRPPRAFAEAAVGYSRAAVGGQVAFAFPTFAEAVRRLFPRRNFVDERFFVRGLGRAEAVAIGGASVVVVVVMGGLLIWAAIAAARRRFAMPRPLALLALWWGGCVGFFTLWDPANPDFWIPAVCFTPILTAATLTWARGAVPLTPYAVLAVALLLVTGCGTIRLAMDPRNDYYTVYLGSLRHVAQPGDVLVMGDSWPLRTHVPLRSQVTPVFLVNEFRRRADGELANAVQRARASGRRVFLGPDLFVIDPSTTAATGPAYDAYVAALRARVCGLGPSLGGPEEMPIREVTCFKAGGS